MPAPRDPTPEEHVEVVRALEAMRPPLPLSPSEMIRWARRAKMLEVPQGQTLMTQGSAPDYLYLLISGQLRALDTSGDQPRLLNYVGAPAFVGEWGVLHHTERTATVDVISDARLACWSEEEANRLLRGNGAMRAYLTGLYARYTERAGQQFPGKHWDETVVFRGRRHVARLVGALIFPFFLFMGGLALWLVSGVMWAPSFSVDLVSMGLILAGLAWGAFSFFEWANDEYIVTSQRVIHIEQWLLYGEQMDAAPLERVQDVTVTTTSLFQRLLDYSDMYIKTAGAGVIEFSGIRHAEQVKELIFQEQARERERRFAEDRAMVRAALKQSMYPAGLNGQPGRAANASSLSVGTSGYASDVVHIRRLPPVIGYLYPRLKIMENNSITWRKHWFILMRKVFPPVLALNGTLATLIVFLVLRAPIHYLAMSAAGAAVAFVWYLWRYDDWYRDVYIIRGDRIIDVKSSGFRLRGEERRETTFDKIQNVNYAIPTFWHRLINMGNVVIETAGTERTLNFNSVFDPSGVQQEVFDRWHAYHEERRRREQELQRQQLAGWFGEYHLLQSQLN